MYVSCHRHFFLLLLLNQQWSPPLRLQVSHCSTFLVMCDVSSIAVFCESIECFPGIVTKFFFKLLVTIPVAPIITGTIVHFRFHIRCISIHKLLYFNFFRFLLHNISVCGYCHIYQCACLLLLLLLLTAIGLSPGGSGYFTCIQNMNLVTNKFKSGGLHEKHVVATWNLRNHLSICWYIYMYIWCYSWAMSYFVRSHNEVVNQATCTSRTISWEEMTTRVGESLFIDCHTFTDRVEQVVSVVSGQKTACARAPQNAPRAQVLLS